MGTGRGAAKWRSRNRIGVGTEETATDAEFGVTSFRFGEQQWFAEQVLPSGRRCAGPERGERSPVCPQSACVGLCVECSEFLRGMLVADAAKKKVAALKNEYLAQGRSVNVVSEFRVSARETFDGRGGSAGVHRGGSASAPRGGFRAVRVLRVPRVPRVPLGVGAVRLVRRGPPE